MPLVKAFICPRPTRPFGLRAILTVCPRKKNMFRMIYGTFAWVDRPAMGRGLNSSRAIPLAYMPSSHCQNITTTNTFCQLNFGRVKLQSFGYFLTNLFVVKVLVLGTTRDVFALKANQPMGKVIYSTQNVYFKKLLIFFILIIKRFCFYCSTKSQFLSIS